MGDPALNSNGGEIELICTKKKKNDFVNEALLSKLPVGLGKFVCLFICL